MFFSCGEQTWGETIKQSAHCTEHAACCKQQQIKNSQVRSDSLWLVVFHLWRIGHQMCAFHDVRRPSLPSSPVQFPPLYAMQKCSPCILFPSAGRRLYTRSLCRAASSRGLGVSGRSPVKEAVSERGGAGWRCRMRKGSFYLSLLSDMALVRVWGISVWGSTTASSLACSQILSLSVSSAPTSLSLCFPSPFLYEVSGVSHPRLLGEWFNCSLSSSFNIHVSERPVTDPPLLQKTPTTYSLPQRLVHLQRQQKYTLQKCARLSLFDGGVIPPAPAMLCPDNSSVLFAVSECGHNMGR